MLGVREGIMLGVGVGVTGDEADGVGVGEICGIAEGDGGGNDGGGNAEPISSTVAVTGGTTAGAITSGVTIRLMIVLINTLPSEYRRISVIKIRRKMFVHKALRGEEYREQNRADFNKVLRECMDFVDTIGYERVENVAEYTACQYRPGDDGNTIFAVWYWEEIEGPDLNMD